MRLVRKDALPLMILATGLLVATRGWGVPGTDVRHGAPNEIFVEQVGGTVDVTAADAPQAVAVGSKLELPSRIITGENGRISIRQSQTGVSVAPLSDIEIPATARDGQLIARMIQHSGNVFYDVEPRPIEKLRIETPYLVAVVKGTQFNVSIEEGRTVVSLFEGVLELHSPDDSQTVELLAGQIAVGTLSDGLRVLPMDADALEQTVPGADGTAVAVAGSIRAVDDSAVAGAVAEFADPPAGIGGAVGPVADVVIDSKLPTADLGLQATTAVGAGVELAGTVAGVDAGVAVVGDLSGGNVDASLGVDLAVAGDTGVDAGLSAGVDAGPDLGGGVDVQATVDVGADVGVGTVDVSLDASLDLGVSSVDVGLDLGNPDASVSGALDLGSGTASGTDPGAGAADANSSLTDSLPLPLL